MDTNKVAVKYNELHVENLRLAADLVRHSWEDLKNHREIREENTHTELRKIEEDLRRIHARLCPN